MEQEVRFAENVILIDVAFLNEIVNNSKGFLEERIGRKLPMIDLPGWLDCLALDAGLQTGDNDIQVILVRDEACHELKCCEPAALDELDGKACRTNLGEMVFQCVSSVRIASTEQLYLDLMTLALDAKEVKRLLLVSFQPLYGDKVEEGLRSFFKDKEEKECGKAVYFTMEEPLEPVLCPWELVFYSLGHAFGIQPEELK